MKQCNFLDGREVIDCALKLANQVWTRNQDQEITQELARHNPGIERLRTIFESIFTDDRIDAGDYYSYCSDTPDYLTGIYHTNGLFGISFSTYNGRLARPLESFALSRRFFWLEYFSRFFELTPTFVESLSLSQQGFGFQRHDEFHIIASVLGAQIGRHLWSNPRANSIVADPVITYLQRELQACIHAGYSLYTSRRSLWDEFKTTPLQSFLLRCSHILQRHSQTPIQYWVATLSDAGIDLLEYGNKELGAWQNGFQIEIKSLNSYRGTKTFITGFIYGSEVEQCRISLKTETTVKLYRAHLLPGSWPGNSYMPRLICWRPSREDRMNGEEWVVDQKIKIYGKPQSSRAPTEASSLASLYLDTQDDHSVIMRQTYKERHTKVRLRRGSEPLTPTVTMPSDDVWDSRKPWLRGYLHYCPHFNSRTLSFFPRCDRWDPKQACCSSPIWSDSYLLDNLSKRKQFINDHGVNPIWCSSNISPSLVSGDWFDYSKAIANPLNLQPLDAMSLFGDNRGDAFCEAFPRCVHQKSYLDLISSRSED